MKQNNVKILLDKTMPNNVDIQHYIKKLQAQYKHQTIERVNFLFQSEALTLRYRIKNNPFECILRISTEDMALCPAI